MKEVTDPEILRQLNEGNSLNLREVTDPDILKQLNDSPHRKPISLKNSQFDPSFLEKLSPNIVSGFATLGHQIVNSPHNISKYISEKGLLSPKIADMIPKQQDYNFSEMMGIGARHIAERQFLEQDDPQGIAASGRSPVDGLVDPRADEAREALPRGVPRFPRGLCRARQQERDVAGSRQSPERGEGGAAQLLAVAVRGGQDDGQGPRVVDPPDGVDGAKLGLRVPGIKMGDDDGDHLILRESDERGHHGLLQGGIAPAQGRCDLLRRRVRLQGQERQEGRDPERGGDGRVGA